MNWPTNTASPEYNALVLDAIRSGNFEATWGTITSDAGGHHGEFRVFADALKIEGVRIDVSAELEQQIADLLSCSLMTGKIADLVWLQRAVTLLPSPQPITSSSKGMREHSERIDAMLAKLPPVPKGAIIQTVGKNWIITNDVLQHPGRATNYGWAFPGNQFGGSSWEGCVTGKCRLIQGQGWAHDIKHVDYSQTCVLVARACLVDGQPADLHAVMTSDALAPLVSHQGKMLVLRQPGVVELPSIYAPEVASTASTPFRRVSFEPVPGPGGVGVDRGTDWGAVAGTGLALAGAVGLFWWGLKAMGGAAKHRVLRENPMHYVRYSPRYYRGVKYVIFEMPGGRFEAVFETRSGRTVRVKSTSVKAIEADVKMKINALSSASR